MTCATIAKMSSMTLEVLDADDWRRWRAVRLAALLDAPHAFRPRHADWVDAPEQRYRERLAAVPYNVLAVLNGEDVGLAAGTTPDAACVSHLRSLWVAPAGRGQGVGEALVEAVATWARCQGAVTLALSVRTANAPAIGLYERLGFVDRGPRVIELGVPPERMMTRPLV